MLLPGPFECSACGEVPVRTQRAGSFSFARCGQCHHASVAVEDLPRALAAVSYDQAYAGFRPDPLFSTFVQGFLQTELAPVVGPEASILDLGCGNGEFLSSVREAGLRGLGWDVSESAVAIARQRGLDAIVGDLDEVIPPGAFDLVTMWDVIEHVPAPRRLLRSAVRALRPGGRVLIKTPSVAPRVVDLCARLPRLGPSLLGLPGHIQFFVPGSLIRALVMEGLHVEREFAIGPIRSLTRGGGLVRQVRRRVASGLGRALGGSNLLTLARQT